MSLLHSKCAKTAPLVLHLSSEDQRHVYDSIFVDLNHKLVACLPSKTGCTTWKSILANNSDYQSLPTDYNTKLMHTNWLDKKNIVRLSHFNTTMQQFYLTNKDYYKFMVARRPFDRLYSAYRNKFAPPGALAVTRTHGAHILELFHPFMNKTLQQLGQGVTFREFIQYLELPLSFNLHWESVYDLCQPCVIQYDEILKTETYPGDIEHIILNHLGPYHRGFGTKHNVASGGITDASLTDLGRHMEEYSSLAQWHMDYLTHRYQQDLQYFGYSWRKDHTGIYTSCTKGSVDQPCC